MMKKINNLFAAVLIIILNTSIGTAGNGNIILNGSFELDTDGNGMADYWYFSGNQGVNATWARDQGFVGEYSQSITCTSFDLLSTDRYVLLAQKGTVQLEEGRWYKLSFTARQEGIISQVGQVAVTNMETWLDSGLKESFQVKNEWKQYEFVFQAKETANHVRLQFGYTTTGTFWLDDVRMESTGPVSQRFKEVIPPTTAVNLIPNSSFECGISGWGSIADLPEWIGNLDLPVGQIDDTEALFGNSSFKIDLRENNIPVFHFDGWLYRIPVKAPLLANRGWITVEPYVNYSLSAYIKGSVSSLQGTLSVQQAFGDSIERQVVFVPEWTMYSLQFQPRSEQIFISLGLDLDLSQMERGTVWIDGVQLVKKSLSPPYTPRASVEIGLHSDRLGNIFHYGTEPEMVATVFNSEQAARWVTLRFTTTDFDDNVVYSANQKIYAPSRQSIRVPVDPGVRSKGFYRLDLSCNEAEVAMTRPLRFAIIEPYKRADGLFGMNHAYPWPHLLDLSKDIGILWFRDWSLQWQHVEPEKGKFDFTETNYQINRVLGRNLKILGLLPFPSSEWATSAGPEVKDRGYPPLTAFMPRDNREFERYVRSTIEEYHTKINVWEVLNEPIYSFYALPEEEGYIVDDYINLLKIAYDAIKDVAPESLVIGGIGGPQQAEEFIRAGGLDSVDILNLHIFPDLTAPCAYEEPLRSLRELMQTSGYDIPIWITENGYYADDDLPYEPWDSTWLEPVSTEIEASEWQIKFNTLMLTYGVQKIIYHSGTPSALNNEDPAGIFFEWAAEPRKMLATQSAMANLFSITTSPLGPIKSPEEVKAYGFSTDGQTIIVAWVKEGANPLQLSLANKPWKAIDLQGNEYNVNIISLTERPVYFIANGTMPKIMPW